MFDRDAARLTRIDWTKYALSALNPSAGQEPTAEQLKQAILGMATGFNQFAQELSQLLGGPDIPVKHRAPLALIGYEPDAPGVNDDTDIGDTYPRLMAWSGDSYYDPADGYAKGGLAGMFQGVVIMRPNVNNVNVNIGGAQHNIVLWGQNGAGINFENVYVTNIYDQTGSPWLNANTTIPYIKVGLGTSNPVAQTISASTTLEVAWSNDFTVNTDSAVLSQDGADPSYPNILLAVAGTYRIFYKINLSKSSTAAGDERLAITSTVIRDRSGVDTVVDQGTDGKDMWHSETLGTFRISVVGETAAEFLAGDKIRIDLSMASGPTRTAFLTTGEFCVMLLKRA